MDKIYEYNGKYYSETDYSMELPDNAYGGDLFDLYWDYNRRNRGVLCETKCYYSAYNPETVYDSAEELVEDFFSDSEITYADMIEKENK